MHQIIEYIKTKYSPIGIIVYGSFADGSNNDNSDFDVLVITESGTPLHDNTIVDGVMLDAFIVQKENFLGNVDCEEYLQIHDGVVVLDVYGVAEELKSQVQEHIDNIPLKTYEENKVSVAWCEKMLLRAKRDDIEGRFRWHWLLTESLEIYCDVIGKRYLGPKKSIKRMMSEDKDSYFIYEKALTNFDYSLLSKWICHIKGLLK